MKMYFLFWTWWIFQCYGDATSNQAVASCITPGDHGSTFAGEGSTTNGTSWEDDTPQRYPEIPKHSKEIPNHKLLVIFHVLFGIFQKNMDEILVSTIFLAKK